VGCIRKIAEPQNQVWQKFEVFISSVTCAEDDLSTGVFGNKIRDYAVQNLNECL